MNLALDLGTHACRSLRGSRSGLAARRSRSLAAWLSDGDLQRTWLERNHVPYFPCDDHLALIGDHAEEIAAIFPVPYQDLLCDGKVPFEDSIGRQLIALIIEALLPVTSDDSSVCCFSQPAYGVAAPGANLDLDRRFEFTSRLIRLRGYHPCPINPGVALVLAAMEAEKFTGIGLNLGASGCDLALTHRGNPAGMSRVNRGGRWIDEELSRQSGAVCRDLVGQRVFDVEAARRRREALTSDSSGDCAKRIVDDLCRQLVDDLLGAVEQLVAGNALLVRFSQPLSIVLGGEIARCNGFDEMFRTEAARRFPSSLIGNIRCDDGGEYTTARGCLIHATLAAQNRKAA